MTADEIHDKLINTDLRELCTYVSTLDWATAGYFGDANLGP